MGTTHLAAVGEVARPDEAQLSSLGDIHIGLAHVAAMMGRPDAAVEAFARARAAHRAIDHHAMLAADAWAELEGVTVPYRTTQLAERRRLRAEFEAIMAR